MKSVTPREAVSIANKIMNMPLIAFKGLERHSKDVYTSTRGNLAWTRQGDVYRAFILHDFEPDVGHGIHAGPLTEAVKYGTTVFLCSPSVDAGSVSVKTFADGFISNAATCFYKLFERKSTLPGDAVKNSIELSNAAVIASCIILRSFMANYAQLPLVLSWAARVWRAVGGHLSKDEIGRINAYIIGSARVFNIPPDILEKEVVL